MINFTASKLYLFVQRNIQTVRESVYPSTLRQRSSRRTAAVSARNEIASEVQLPDSRKTGVYMLGSVMLVMISLSIPLNIIEGEVGLVPPLAATACVAMAALLWIHFVGAHATPILFILNFSLILLGMFLLLCEDASGGGSLFWFIVFPPMAMVSLGLRNGKIIFFGFYLILILFLFTPLDAFLVHPYSNSIRIRVVLAMFGAFFFSWWVEFLRFRTNQLLIKALKTLEQDSLTDHLTGLANRRDFHATLSRTMSACRRKTEPYGLALIDLDYFKRVNDRYGHQVGDNVLRHAAETIFRQIRATDRMFRWGGEEFAVIMPGCGAEQALVVAERIRRQVESTPYVFAADAVDDASPLILTLSVGLYCGVETQDPDVPITIADANLYHAKSTGRNKVVCGLE